MTKSRTAQQRAIAPLGVGEIVFEEACIVNDTKAMEEENNNEGGNGKRGGQTKGGGGGGGEESTTAEKDEKSLAHSEYFSGVVMKGLAEHYARDARSGKARRNALEMVKRDQIEKLRRVVRHTYTLRFSVELLKQGKVNVFENVVQRVLGFVYLCYGTQFTVKERCVRVACSVTDWKDIYCDSLDTAREVAEERSNYYVVSFAVLLKSSYYRNIDPSELFIVSPNNKTPLR